MVWTQSFKAGKRGTGGETGRRGVTGRSLTSLHESHSEDDRERGYRTPSATRYRKRGYGPRLSLPVLSPSSDFVVVSPKLK